MLGNLFTVLVTNKIVLTNIDFQKNNKIGIFSFRKLWNLLSGKEQNVSFFDRYGPRTI